MDSLDNNNWKRYFLFWSLIATAHIVTVDSCALVISLLIYLLTHSYPDLQCTRMCMRNAFCQKWNRHVHPSLHPMATPWSLSQTCIPHAVFGLCLLCCLTDYCLFIAALRSRCGHYIFLLLSSIFFFPRLISAVPDWMSTILLHVAWI